MKIAPLREQVEFQSRTVVQDSIGNESTAWSPLFSRWCTCRTLNKIEVEGSVIRMMVNKVQFTLRYDHAVLDLNSLKTRILFRGKAYSIESIDGDTVPRQLIYIVATLEDEHG